MHTFSQTLGDVVREARERQVISQAGLAERLGLDVRTIINIENYRGNPKMEVLFPLIRELKIPPEQIFFPELAETGNSEKKVFLEISDCSEQELEAIITLIRSFKEAVRTVKGSSED